LVQTGNGGEDLKYSRDHGFKQQNIDIEHNGLSDLVQFADGEGDDLSYSK